MRARRELKLQETLLEGMVRQYEIAKLDEAKEGPSLQQVDVALPPDRKSQAVARADRARQHAASRCCSSSAFVIWRRYAASRASTTRSARTPGRRCAARGG